jgi:hypothetical protein
MKKRRCAVTTLGLPNLSTMGSGVSEGMPSWRDQAFRESRIARLRIIELRVRFPSKRAKEVGVLLFSLLFFSRPD